MGRDIEPPIYSRSSHLSFDKARSEKNALASRALWVRIPPSPAIPTPRASMNGAKRTRSLCWATSIHRVFARRRFYFLRRYPLRLPVTLYPNCRRIGGNGDLLFSVLVFQRQRPTIDRADDLLDVGIGHRTLRPQVPRI